MSATSGIRTPAPVTVVMSRRVRSGREREFERLMAGMQASAATFPGHMGGFLMHPEPGDECYRMLFAFDTEPHLRAWRDSGERHQWLAQIADMTHGETAMRVLTGLETWFALPRAATRVPPPRWKMALMTWSGIFPLVLLTSVTLTPLFGRWLPVPITALLVTGVITAAMTWLVMPLLVRLFARWLYPPLAHAPAPHPAASEHR